MFDDLYLLNPEPTGFRIVKNGGRKLKGVFPTYEAAERAAQALGLR